jgi:hypothetical protein
MVLVTDFSLHMNNLLSHLCLLALHLFTETCNILHHSGLLGQTLSPHVTIASLYIFNLSLQTTWDFFLKLSHSPV